MEVQSCCRITSRTQHLYLFWGQVRQDLGILHRHATAKAHLEKVALIDWASARCEPSANGFNMIVPQRLKRGARAWVGGDQVFRHFCCALSWATKECGEVSFIEKYKSVTYDVHCLDSRFFDANRRDAELRAQDARHNSLVIPRTVSQIDSQIQAQSTCGSFGSGPIHGDGRRLGCGWVHACRRRHRRGS